MHENEINPDNCFHRIVTGDETCLYYYDLLSQQEANVWKKSDEPKPTRLRRTRPAEKIMMVIFWEKSDILLSEYLPDGTTISSLYYAAIIERLSCAILEKRDGKVNDEVLLLHGNTLVDKCNIVHTAIRKGNFIELNDPVYSSDIASTYSQS